MGRFYEDIRLLGGTVSIGSLTTIDPNNIMEITGNSAIIGTLSTTNLKVSNGAQNGYILQSDASGNATWVTATAASANFANTDLTLTSNRQHTIPSGNTLLIAENYFTTGPFLFMGGSGSGDDYTFLGHDSNYYEVDGNALRLNFNSQVRVEVDATETVINEVGGNYDFRVEGDTDQNLFFLDASTDGIAIGTSTTFTGVKATINTNSSSKYLGLNVDANSYSGTFNYGIISNAQSTSATNNIGIESRPSNGISQDIGFKTQLGGTTITKKGLDILINGNGLSTTNYGHYTQISGASSTQYGYYTLVSGTYSNYNYGSYTSLQLGNGGGYGNYITLSGDSSFGYYGQYIDIVQNTGTSSANNTGSYLRMMGDGGYNIGSRIECKYGIWSNIAVAAISGSSFAYTVGDIALYAMVADDAQLTSYSSEAGRFDNRSKTTGVSTGVNISVSGTYSSSNVGLSISSLPTLGGPNNAILTYHGHNIFNENGGDYDFRIEGLTESNLFFVDASNDAVGIATNTPGADFEVNGFTKLGSNAPAIKTELIEVTTPSSGISGQNTVHGITGTIIGYTIVCEAVDNKLIKPFDTTTANSNYTAYVTTTALSRSGDWTTNSNVANSPLRFYITYIE